MSAKRCVLLAVLKGVRGLLTPSLINKVLAKLGQIGHARIKAMLRTWTCFCTDETKEGVEEVVEGVETVIETMPGLYWIILWSGTALVIVSVIVALCYIRYRKNRKYTM